MIGIGPAPGPIRASVTPPGSKYEANRLLLAAALTGGESRILGIPENDDLRAAAEALGALGARIESDGDETRVRGFADHPAGSEVSVSVGESGTLLRFLTAAAATLPATVSIRGSGRIPERPISGLVEALEQLGAEVETTAGHAPVRVRSGTLRGGRVRVAAGESSQFASALLLAAPRARGAVAVELAGEPVSAPYLDLTVSVMARCGVRVRREGARSFGIGAGARYRPGVHRVSGDWTAASTWFAAAALAPGTVTVSGLDPGSPQGERRFPEVLARMGCEVGEARADAGARVTVRGPRRLRGVEVEMGSMPDAVPNLAAIASFARTPTRISGIGHLRLKESDRSAALAEGLSRLGGRVSAGDSGMRIAPATLRAAELDPRGDHRIAMALALVGIRVAGVRIATPEVVRKSYPGFWGALAGLGARVSGDPGR